MKTSQQQLTRPERSKRVSRGDYVLASKYSDGDPKDHWCIGFYHSSYDHFGQERHLVTESNGNQFRANGFRRVQKISKERGAWMVTHSHEIEQGGFSVWYYYYRPICGAQRPSKKKGQSDK